MKYEVRPHPFRPRALKIFVVTTTKGRVYACASEWTLGHTEPTPETVKYCWKHSRHNFLPYNEGTGHYL